MKIEQLIYFVKIARTQSISLAAEQLHISQPSISVAISDLEKELGIKLFIRSRSGTSLTLEAEPLLEEAKNILQSIENFRALANIEYAAIKEELTIATIPSLGLSLVPELVSRFKMQFPNVSVHIYSGGTNRVTREVALGSADIGFIAYRPESEISWEKYQLDTLFGAPIVACVSHDLYMKLGEKNDVSLAELAPLPLVTYNAEYSYQRYIIESLSAYEENKVFVSADNYEAVQQMCARSLGVGFMPKLVTHTSRYENMKTLHVLNILDIPQLSSYASLYIKSRTCSVAFREFLKQLAIIAQEYRLEME